MSKIVNLLVINTAVEWSRVTKLYGDLYHGRIKRLYVALRPGSAGTEAQARVARLLPNCEIKTVRETKWYRLVKCKYLGPATKPSTTPGTFPPAA